MKNILIVLSLLVANSGFGQEYIEYENYIGLDLAGERLTSMSALLKVEVRKENELGELIYSELLIGEYDHEGRTSLKIGSGSSTTGDFSQVLSENSENVVVIRPIIFEIEEGIFNYGDQLNGLVAEFQHWDDGDEGGLIAYGETEVFEIIGPPYRLSPFEEEEYTGKKGKSRTRRPRPLNRPPFLVGDSAYGGIVFWIDTKSQTGLITALDDTESCLWGAAGVTTKSWGTGIFDGIDNTRRMIDASNGNQYASGICKSHESDISGGGWYMPSRLELHHLLAARDKVNETLVEMSKPELSNSYMSSTELSHVEYVSVSAPPSQTGSTGTGWSPTSKLTQGVTRPVKSFSWATKNRSTTSSSDRNEQKYRFGDYAQGGIVFWVDESGEHGLVVSMHDQITPNNDNLCYTWGNSTDPYHCKAFRWGIYGGMYNTQRITEKQVGRMCSPAIGCAQYDGGGYGDWYLPSYEELKRLFQSKGAINMFLSLRDGDPLLEQDHWSSTENGTKVNGWSATQQKMVLLDKTAFAETRAIRAF